MSRKAVSEYFDSLHCELWPAETFYLTDPKERDRAIAWVLNLMKEVENGVRI